MRFSYYNLDKDDLNKKHSRFKKKKLFSIYFTTGSVSGLGSFCYGSGVGGENVAIGFLGCATREIAQHFGKYFGMLITEAKYSDMVDFEITDY